LEDIFFAKQVIKNACATLAILNLLLNTSHPDVALGSTLSEFKEFTLPLDPSSRGLAVTNSDHIRKAHNSFSRQQMFEFDEQLAKKDDDVFHFVAYVEVKGRLYELDGLKEGPVDLGKCDEGDWLKTVKPVLDKRIQSYTAGEIHFNLMAIVTDRKMQLERQIAQSESQRDMAAKRIEALIAGEVTMEDSSGLPSDPAELQTVIEEAETQLASLQEKMAEETSKLERYKLENIRRKHNYLPLIMELLKILARRGQLVPLVEQAKRKKQQQREQKEKKNTASTETAK
jgi:ubiquitin carboxyl-terminal hydrolase L5